MNSKNGNNDALANIIKKIPSIFFCGFLQKVHKWLIKRILNKTYVWGTLKVAVDFDAFHFMEDEPIIEIWSNLP